MKHQFITKKYSDYDWYAENVITPSDCLMWALLKMNMPVRVAMNAYERKATKMELTFFEMRDELKSSGMCYALRESSKDDAWLVYYDVPTNTYRITDWINNSQWNVTIDDLEATDWMVYRYIM